MRSSFLLPLAILFLLVSAFAQTAVQPSAPISSADLEKLVSREFGTQFKSVPKFPAIVGDMNRDGEEDLVVVVTGKNPLLGEGEFHYKVTDPYNSAFGYGDPRVTHAFGSADGDNSFLLVVHSWRNTTPKAKFVLINIPIKKLDHGVLSIKKKPIFAVQTTDGTGAQGVVYWDGKKYKWESIGTENE